MILSLSMVRKFQKCYITLKCPQSKLNFSKKMDEDNIKVTDDCVKQLKSICDPGEFLRLSVESGGCSGFQYKFELDSTVAKDDYIYEEKGVKIVVDTTSLDYVKGSTIDYEQQLIRAAFKLIGNPKAQDGCSCGASFSVKID